MENNLKMDDFLSFLPLAICELNPSENIIRINKEFGRVFGYSISELKAKKLTDIVMEKEKLAQALATARGGEQIRDQELTLICKDKKRIPVLAAFAAKKSGNKFTGYFVSLLEISELKSLQEETEKKISQRTEELKESRRALLNILEDTEAAKVQAETEKNKAGIIFDNFLDGLLILDAENRLELINPAAEKFLSIKEEEFIGKNIEDLKDPKEARKIARFCRKIKEVSREELPIGDGETVVEVTTKFIGPEDKRLVTLVILHDISREKVVEKLKSQFVSVAAHQLRTPLSIIKWSLCMILDGEAGILNKEQTELLEKANQTNERMIHLINDLLNVARIEEGRFMYHPKTVDMIEVLEAVVGPAKELAKKKGVILKLVKPKDGKAKIVKIDIEKVSLAFKNLVENAIFYTPEKGTVTVSVKRKKDEIFVSVADTGIGIPKNQHDKVFSKFFRADNAVRMETEGTGLGLFIVNNVIKAHDGQITFESEEGKGTIFTLSLPLIA